MADIILSFKYLSELQKDELFMIELSGITTQLYIYKGSTEDTHYATGRYNLTVTKWERDFRVMCIEIFPNIHESIEIQLFKELF